MKNRQPAIGGAIFYRSQEPMDPNPAPAVVDAIYEGDIIDCTVTLADGSTRQECGVFPAPAPNQDYYRYWEFGE